MQKSIRKAKNSPFNPGRKALRRALARYETGLLDTRTRISHLASQLKQEIVRDLGGDEAISRQQHALVGLAVRGLLIVEALDRWIYEQPTLVVKRRLIQAAKDRFVIADSISRQLQALGLERRLPPPRSKWQPTPIAPAHDDAAE